MIPRCVQAFLLPLLFTIPAWGAGPFDALPSAETAPVASSGDAADDPAIWVHPDDPSKSLIIGTDKQRGLALYDLQGALLDFVEGGQMNNVDVRYNFPLAARTIDIAITTNRTNNTIAVYEIDPNTPSLKTITARDIALGFAVYGCCLYRRADTGAFYVFANAKDGSVEQWELFATPEDAIDARKVRAFNVGGQVEGCVADDILGYLYVGEENAAIWKYPANPEAEIDGDGEVEPLERDLVDVRRPWGNIEPDVEGITIVHTGDRTGYLIASSQGSDEFLVYSRDGHNTFLGAFRVVATENVDAVTGTDGIDATAVDLGPMFPHGMFVAQDDENDSGAQNFKLVPWQAIVSAFDPPLATVQQWNPRTQR